MPINTDKTSQGFILTRERQELAGEQCLEYWLTTDNGPVKLISPRQRDVFFIKQSDKHSVDTLLAKANMQYTYQALSLKTFQQEAVAALYFSKTSTAFKAKRYLKDNDITLYEDDIRLTERFLMERFVYGSTEYSGEAHTNKHFNSIYNAKLKPANYRPTFKVLSLDIECSEKGELYSIGLAATDYRCVMMIGASEAGPDWITWVNDERQLLASLIDKVTDYDPDIFVGWNVINFDFRLLIKRATRHKIDLLLGRNQQAVYWRDAPNEENQGFVSMSGRIVVDGIDALKAASYHFDSFSLEFVSQQLLGTGKKTSDVDNRMEAINHDFQHNKIKLAEYNLQDCILVLDIFKHSQLLEFLVLRSQLTGLPLDRIGGSVAAFLNLYLPKLHRAGYVSPNRPADGGLASPGGYVMDSRPGLYNNVLVLDFKSLYPAIIRTFKIDPLGLIEGLKQPDNAIPGYRNAVFSRTEHFLPDIISTLWQQRDQAKKQNDNSRSQAIKILMNSFYGVLGSGGCPFYDTRLASSITLRGHSIMQTTAQWISKEGYEVIYGDTDSIFIALKGEHTSNQAQTIGKHLQQLINQRWNKKIQDDYQLESALEIEFETHFTRFLMPTIRGSQLGSKKRYAGLKSKANGTELVFKGLETVRSDWTALAKAFQYELYKRVFTQQDVNVYIKSILLNTRLGLYDEQLVYRKRLRRPLDHYIKNVPPHVRAARLADAKNLANGKTLRYQHKGWINYIITLNGPEPIEYIESPIDYEHYIDKQIRPIAEAILPFIGLSFEAIGDAQIALF